jgi:serine/threonine protein kinase
VCPQNTSVKTSAKTRATTGIRRVAGVGASCLVDHRRRFGYRASRMNDRDQAQRDRGMPRSSPNSSSPETVVGSPTADSTVVSSGAATPAPQPLARIGRYQLLTRLGVGGMAEVYLAEQAGVAGFQKKVVVKRILPHLAANRQFVEMFAREARVAARLSHTNVVQIFELGEEHGEFFIAMEHIDGLTLHRLAVAAWEQQLPLPLDVVLRTLADAALGLFAAHTLTDEAGKPLRLVHRDVSPDNLMLSKDGVTKVLDFGIAKGDLGGPQTKTGNLRGKIPFMPPEQIRGEVLDGRADLYALGVSAYWMLTGQRPFDRQSDWHTMQAIITEFAAPPSTLNPAVPPAVDALVLRLLEKDRSRRPDNGRLLADELEALASPSSVGGKKTTLAFLEQILPASSARANPLSGQEIAGPPPPPLPPTPMASPPSSPPPQLTAPNESSRPAREPTPVAPPPQAAGEVSFDDPTVVGGHAAATARHEARAGIATAALTPAVVDPDQPALIRPVTIPATKNAFANVLAPKKSGGSSPAVVGGALIASVVIVVGLAAAVWRVVGPPVSKELSTATTATPTTTTAPAPAPAPATTTAPAPAPATTTAPAPAPAATTATASLRVEARRTPSRIRWSVGDTVVGVGDGILSVPAGTTALRAFDLRRRVSYEVRIVEGVVDFGALPVGHVTLAKASPRQRVIVGDDDVTTQRRLALPAGRYRFRVQRDGTSKETDVDVVAGRDIVFDASR